MPRYRGPWCNGMANHAGPEAVSAGARVLALAGPTASGKTAAALAIAQEHDAEIISVDSALVYRGMDIGTAKPSPAERGSVPHHLIDIRDPLQAYSAAEFAADAQRLVAQINARGKMALLVGGTMLYFKALFEGLDAMPAADRAARAEVEAEAAAKGWPAMHAELALVDPATAARLAPNDAQRIQRALEVFRVSGRPLSSFHQRTADAPALGCHAALLAGAARPRLAARTHCAALRRYAGRRLPCGGGDFACARRSQPRPAQHALCRLPPGLGGSRWPLAHDAAARQGHLRHPPARQAPTDLAAQHAAAAGDRLRCARCDAAAAGIGAGGYPNELGRFQSRQTLWRHGCVLEGLDRGGARRVRCHRRRVGRGQVHAAQLHGGAG